MQETDLTSLLAHGTLSCLGVLRSIKDGGTAPDKDGGSDDEDTDMDGSAVSYGVMVHAPEGSPLSDALQGAAPSCMHVVGSVPAWPCPGLCLLV